MAKPRPETPPITINARLPAPLNDRLRRFAGERAIKINQAIVLLLAEGLGERGF